MIDSVLPSIHARPFPTDVEWQVQLYSRLSEAIKKAATSLEAIQRGRSDEWITIWRVPISDGQPDVLSAAPCSLHTDFLARQLDDVWYYVNVHSEVALGTRDDFLRCRTGTPRVKNTSACGGSCGTCGSACGSRPTEENTRLMRSLDSQTALVQISDERAIKSRADAEQWHSECLAHRQTIADLEIDISKLRAALDEAVANQAPVIENDVAEKLGGEILSLGTEWLSKPNDKGLAAKVLQAELNLMASIQFDDELKVILLTRHGPEFSELIDVFNEVAKASGLPGKLELPPMPRLVRRSSKSSGSVRRGR